MENNQDVLLKVEHLKKYYSIKSSSLRGKKSVVKAVDDISFDVKIGETFGIVGESGCGKSTMGKSVIRLIEPTEGKVILDGQDFTSLKGKELQEARDKIKLIFQDPYASLNPRMTVKDIIAEPIDIAKCYKTKEERDARVVEVKKQVGLNLDYMYRYPHEYPLHYVQQDYLPEALRGTVYCHLTEEGYEHKQKVRLTERGVSI